MPNNHTSREYRRVQATRPVGFDKKENPVARPKHPSTVPVVGPRAVVDANAGNFPQRK